jgi:hypothetical protein
MGMLRQCSVPGCPTFTLGLLCLEHEQAGRESQSVHDVKPRGKPTAGIVDVGGRAV